MQKKFKREFNSLGKIHQFIHRFAEKHHLDHKTIFATDLIVEEIFTNAVKYISDNTNDVTIELSIDDGRLIISIIDTDVEPFDISQIQEFDPTTPLEERRIGGLGIPLVKRLTDKIEYEYKDRRSKITLIKYLENADVQRSHQ